MQTVIDVNSRQAVKRWAASLARDTAQQEYFDKFTGEGENNIIERKVELESDAGDEIRFDLSMRLRGDITEGDNVVEGREEGLSFYQDSVRIDQARKGVDAGGRMTRKRTLHSLRTIAKERTAEYLAEWIDEIKMVYLSGTAPGLCVTCHEGDKGIEAAARMRSGIEKLKGAIEHGEGLMAGLMNAGMEVSDQELALAEARHHAALVLLFQIDDQTLERLARDAVDVLDDHLGT